MTAGTVARRLGAYARLARFHSVQGTLLLMWPTLWAVWLAGDGTPAPRIVAIFVLGTLAMRAFGCAVNDLADRKIDGHVRRTRHRPLATGEITPPEAVGVAALFLAVAFAAWLALSDAARLWALAGLLVAVTYPYLKRFFAFPQAYLGIAFSFGIPVAYAESVGHVPVEAWLVFAGNFAWVLAYDTVYAMADREDDLRLAVRSSAITLGRWDLLFVCGMHVASLFLLSVAGAVIGLGMVFQLSLLAAMVAVFAFHRMMRDRDPENCLRVFFLNHWIGAAIFAGIWLAHLV